MLEMPTIEEIQRWAGQWRQIKQSTLFQSLVDDVVKKLSAQLAQRVERPRPDQTIAQFSDASSPHKNSQKSNGARTKHLAKVQTACDAISVVVEYETADLIQALSGALEKLGLVPPWDDVNQKTGHYQSDNAITVPLAIRFLDWFRRQMEHQYTDFADNDHPYGGISPISRMMFMRYESGNDQDKINVLIHKVHACLNNLAERLTDFFCNDGNGLTHDRATIRQVIDDKVSTILPDLCKKKINPECILDSIDRSMISITTTLIKRLILDGQLVRDAENTPPNSHPIRPRIKELIKRFNYENNAQNHLNDCYNMAFYKATPSMNENVCALVTRIAVPSTNGDYLSEDFLQRVKHPTMLVPTGVPISRLICQGFMKARSVAQIEPIVQKAASLNAYGLLCATRDILEEQNQYLRKDSWWKITQSALKNGSTEVIELCLSFKNRNGHLWTRKCDQDEQYCMMVYADWMDRDGSDVRTEEPRLETLIAHLKSRAKKDTGYALLRACRNRKSAIVEALINTGAATDCININGETALVHACRHVGTNSAEILIDAGAEVNHITQRGNSALIVACRYGHAKAVAKLLNKGVERNLKNNNGNTALMLAIEHGHTEAAVKLLEAGVDVNVTDHIGDTALMIACRLPKTAQASTITLLIEAGAHVNVKNDRGNTALMLASQYGHIEAVSQLLQAGVEINTSNNCHNTALVFAVACEREPIVKMLVEAGANACLSIGSSIAILRRRCARGFVAIHENMAQELVAALGGRHAIPRMTNVDIINKLYKVPVTLIHALIHPFMGSISQLIHMGAVHMRSTNLGMANKVRQYATSLVSRAPAEPIQSCSIIRYDKRAATAGELILASITAITISAAITTVSLADNRSMDVSRRSGIIIACAGLTAAALCHEAFEAWIGKSAPNAVTYVLVAVSQIALVIMYSGIGAIKALIGANSVITRACAGLTAAACVRNTAVVIAESGEQLRDLEYSDFVVIAIWDM